MADDSAPGDVAINTTETGDRHVVISRKASRGSSICQTIPIKGDTEDARIKGVVEHIIADPKSHEFWRR